MNPFDDEPDDDDIPEMAVKALDAASHLALTSGLAVVLVRNGKLVRIQGDEVTVLKSVPPPRTVAELEQGSS